MNHILSSFKIFLKSSVLIILLVSNGYAKNSIEYDLAIINAGKYIDKNDITVKRFKFLLEQMSSRYIENKEEIANLLVSAREMMEKNGVSETLLNIIEGFNTIIVDKKLSFLECITSYSFVRVRGVTHNEAIDAIQILSKKGSCNPNVLLK